MRISGIARFGDVDSLGTATSAVMDLGAAQSLLGRRGPVRQRAGRPPRRACRRRSCGARSLAKAPLSVRVQSAAASDRFALDSLSQVVKWVKVILVLLALSVIVSLFGIVNTLVLSVFERRRELGMLRAVGMTRRQVRRMVRHESVITALIGGRSRRGRSGLALAGLVTSAFSDQGLAFSVPVGALIAFADRGRPGRRRWPRCCPPGGRRGWTRWAALAYE